MSEPNRSFLIQNNLAHIGRNFGTAQKLLTKRAASLHDKTFIQSHELFHPLRLQKIAAYSDLSCGLFLRKQRSIDERWIQNNVPMIGYKQCSFALKIVSE